MSAVEVKGYCAPEFSALQEDFEANYAEELELGSSLCVTVDGEMVVDIWGGYVDAEKTKPWQEDTIAIVFSSTKIPTIICTLMNIDRGLLELDEPVATYWPEFAQGGKETITVRQAMTHRARVPGFKTPQPGAVLEDWNRVIDLIAAEPAWFDEDTICYHPHTFGFILGELIQRVTGRPIRQFMNEELFEPLGADFHLGLSDKNDAQRVAPFLYNEPEPDLDDGTVEKAVWESVVEESGDPWTVWERMSAVHPASGGFTNARGLCRVGTMLAMGGELDGRVYLSPEILKEATTEQVHEQEPFLGELRLGLGFGLDSPGFRSPTPDSFHWGGHGGSWCFMDPSRRLAGAYVMNCALMPNLENGFSDPRLERYFARFRTMYSVGA